MFLFPLAKQDNISCFLLQLMFFCSACLDSGAQMVPLQKDLLSSTYVSVSYSQLGLDEAFKIQL